MSHPPVWTRIHRRLGRELAVRRHARFDAVLLRRAAAGELSDEETERIAARIGRKPRDEDERGLVLSRAPASLKDAWRRLTPAGPAQAIDAAQGLIADRITLFGVPFPLADPSAWHRDLSTWHRDISIRQRAGSGGSQWPLKPHRQIQLVGPRAPGDVRMQWEAARFHHGLLLGRGYLASGDRAYADAFRRQVDAFLAGNPPFRGIHWAVGMEVAIRAAAWILALEFLRGAAPLTHEWCRAMVRHLLLHGLFLETHIERHPLGFTTNHTLADYAGLAVLGRAFAGSSAGERWRKLAAEGLEVCLGEQVLPGGAHAEGSLAYERFVLEASLVAALCLDREQAAPLRPGIHALARHLRAVTLASGLPFIGDGDDSFFPPFACVSFADWDPFDPEAVLQVAAHWCADPSLGGRPQTEEPALWLGAEVGRGAPTTNVPETEAPSTTEPETTAPETVGPGTTEAATTAPETAGPGTTEPSTVEPETVGPGTTAPVTTASARPETMEGCIRFSAGPFTGLLIARGSGEQWLPTHGHNDLLSIVLEVNGVPLLIDPGTGAYTLEPQLRHALRSTAAHSTLQIDEREQSPIDARRLFEGPAAVPGGLSWSAGLNSHAGPTSRGGPPPPAGLGPQAGPTLPAGLSPQAGSTSPAGLSPQAGSTPHAGLPIEAWHDGFGPEIRHMRRISWAGDCLWIEDRLGEVPAKGGEASSRRSEVSDDAPHTSTLRFRLAPELTLRGVEPPAGIPGLVLPPGMVASSELVDSQGDVPASCVRFEVHGGEVEFLLLRPEKALWQIGSGATSRRYGRWQEAPILQSQWSGPLPHRWVVGIRYRHPV
ncbi:MAG: heparinase II/III family protein [Candidatus Eisenbacteria sp.]|nr:heparinase II/III family protein [Candidatus Eisenbacteria bacterium]